MHKKKKKGILLENTIMLYFLTFSTYLFNFITVPYQTRIFGPDVYGNLGFAQAFIAYFQLILDFGFLLSATAEVSKNRDDPEKLSKILMSVLLCKMLLGVLCFLVIIVLCTTVTKFHDDIPLYFLFFGATFLNSLLPDFLYRGLEKMSVITYRAVGVKFFFSLAIFVILKSKEQYYIVPILNILGAIGACVWIYYDVYYRLSIRITRVSKEYFLYTMSHSASYFFSRIASTVYGATNTFILGFLYPSGNNLGYYSSAEKLITAARGAISPISDSLYPYMVKNKEYKLIKHILTILMPIIIIGCIVVGIFSEPFCVLLFGKDFQTSGVILRYLLPVIVLSLPSYLCGFPVLTPMGLEKYANLSVIYGAIFHIAQLMLLLVFGALNIKSICIVTCVTESVVLLIRVFVILKRRLKMMRKV